jgi:molybdate transport system substrate-binding protein
VDKGRVWATVTLLTLVGALLVGCGGGSPAPPYGTLRIFASRSLTDVITGMATAFTNSYPGVRIETVFEADSVLASRAVDGPTPDLIVAEGPATLVAAGVTASPRNFAQGQLVLAVPAENPARVAGLADLARPGLRVALCAAEEPCGQVADAVLAAGPVTLPEGALRVPDVRSALSHVTDGTADVALVYRSDVVAAGSSVIAIEVPQSATALAQFVAAVPEGAPNPNPARAFLDYLASQAVRDVLTTHGFRPVS